MGGYPIKNNKIQLKPGCFVLLWDIIHSKHKNKGIFHSQSFAAKYILFPLGGPVAHLNNPDNKKGPFRKYLELCSKQGVGILDEQQMIVKTFDFNSNET